MKPLRQLLGACASGYDYVASAGDYRKAWDACERGDWMLWIASERGIDKRKIIKVIVECTRLVEHRFRESESHELLDIADRYSQGLATKDELDMAAAVAGASAADASADYYAAADAAADYYAADDASAADDAEKQTLKKCAEICRKYIDFEDLRMHELDKE